MHFACTDKRIEELVSHIPKFSKISDMEKYRGMFGEIISASKSLSNYSDVLASAKLMALIYSLHRDTFGYITAEHGKTGSKASVVNAVDYIKKHYAEPITVEDLAASCSLSPSYFYRLFYKAAMISPNQYLLNTRLAAAKTVLTSDDCPISVVADRCGFNSQAYFCYCFRKAFGMTPKEFREKFGYGLF